MRTYTDVFKENDSRDDSDSIFADIGGAFVGVEVSESGRSSVVVLTKQQAAEFARQILEMCGEGEDDN